jgi:hypothetical protein
MPGTIGHSKAPRSAVEVWNTQGLPVLVEQLLLPVKKPGTGDQWPVQDLRVVLPNPYTLLSLIPAYATVFTCLDLKDTFFCVRLASQSQ